MSEKFKNYLKDMLERAITTFAEALLAEITTYPVVGIRWKTAIYVASVATIISILKSIVARKIGSKDSASLVQ